MRTRVGAWLWLAATVGCSGSGLVSPPPAGGEATVYDRSSSAFSRPIPGLDADELDLHRAGDAAFEAAFVSAPAPVNPGLGPLYNNLACESCHASDGRGRPIAGDSQLLSQLLVRVSLPDGMGEADAPGGSVPVPGFGLQVADHATFGHEPEGLVAVTWSESTGTYGDGSPYQLREPVVSVTYPNGDALSEDVLTSFRQPPPVFGMGLLAAVPAETIEALADPGDDDGDGISGRANRVWDPVSQAEVLGRFGHKANVPGLDTQTAGAYANDMGVGNRIAADPAGNTDDVADDVFDSVVFYLQTLAVPARAEADDPEITRGERLFDAFGCGGCHVDRLKTGASDVASLAFQTISPYTDLLLHDMGEGLADGRPDFAASGSEWRTPPLWGIGLTHTVLSTGRFLHDGRARTLAEAILWHGGEAEAARESFRVAPADDREALLLFLGTL